MVTRAAYNLFFEEIGANKKTPLVSALSFRDYLIEKSEGCYEVPRILIKREDLFGGTYGGTKIRKIKAIMSEVVALGANYVVTTGNLQSNHARQIAYVCNCLGIPCTVILKNDTPEYRDDTTYNNGNILLTRLFGANVITLSEKEDVEIVIEAVLKRLKSEGYRPYFSPRGGSCSIGDLPYYDCYFEILSQLKELEGNEPVGDRSLYVCAGSGGTHAALSLAAFSLQDSPIQVIGVCNKRTSEQQEVVERQALQYLLSLPISSLSHLGFEAHEVDLILDDSRASNPKYGIITKEILELERLAAKYLGFLIDPTYAMKPFMSMIRDIERSKYTAYDTVIFMQTGSPFNLFGYEPHITKWVESNRAENCKLD